MIDVSTQERITVSADGNAGPYIIAPVEQVPEIEDLLKAHNISYWVDSDSVAMDSAPALTVINLEGVSKPEIT